MLSVPEGLVRETLHTLHDCGAGKNECVVFWLSARGEPDRILRAVHPEHTAAPFAYEVDPRWMHQLWIDLPTEQMTLRAQVHTHLHEAFHSATDDVYPAVQTDGFVSVVLPRLATPPIAASQIHVSVLAADGWRRGTFDREVRVV